MNQQKQGRFLSVDVFRGWTVAAMLLVNNAGDWDHVFPWLEHAEWHGCTPADFIFPFFLLIVGLSVSLALSPQLERGADVKQLGSSVIWRAVRLFVLGLLLHWFATWTIEGRAFRLFGVLQRIGLCFAFAGLTVLYVRSYFQRWILTCLILLASSLALLSYGSLEPGKNLADLLDTLLLGHLAYQFDPLTGFAHDPEGIFSTLPAFASVLLGVQAAHFLRQSRLSALYAIGAGLLVGGYLLSFWLPMNKQLWTASFVLWTSGAAYVVIAFLHWLIDLKHLPAVGRSFGINSIAAYAGSWIATCLLAFTGWGDEWYRNVFYPLLAPRFGENFSSFAFAFAFTAVFAGLMHGMARKGWRIVI
ncbi:acyltransferase family protein [Undibacterium sp. SXout20W]|uniref:acyltransferase family protein n=1 Tax=Undibacterium sp. SXout20W TaxID=3413051 RepID=UPI003BF0D1EA